jgi:hypothetical protein
MIVFGCKENGPAGVRAPRDPAHSHDHAKEATVDTTRVPQPHPDDHDDTIEAHYASLERAVCGCCEGYHYLGHMVIGEHGEEVEVFEAVPCRRCAAAGGVR